MHFTVSAQLSKHKCFRLMHLLASRCIYVHRVSGEQLHRTHNPDAPNVSMNLYHETLMFPE